MISLPRKTVRGIILISFFTAFYLLSRRSTAPEPHLLSRSGLASTQWHASDFETAAHFKTGQVEVHIPDNMMHNWTRGPRIRQASIIFENQRKSIFEPCMETHIDHGRKWGYPTHILKHDLSGKAGWIRLVLEKLLHVLSLLVSEMAKASYEQADWIV